LRILFFIRNWFWLTLGLGLTLGNWVASFFFTYEKPDFFWVFNIECWLFNCLLMVSSFPSLKTLVCLSLSSSLIFVTLICSNELSLFSTFCFSCYSSSSKLFSSFILLSISNYLWRVFYSKTFYYRILRFLIISWRFIRLPCFLIFGNSFLCFFLLWIYYCYILSFLIILSMLFLTNFKFSFTLVSEYLSLLYFDDT